MSHKLSHSYDTTGFGTGHIRIGDLNGDGIPEILLPQAYPMNREISAISAMDLQGNLLWQWGEIGVGGSWGYSDIPIQIIDWDGDGKNEVLFVKQAVYKNALVWQYSKGTHVKMEGLSKEQIRLDPDLATERAMEYEGNATLVILDGATGQTKQELTLPAPADDAIAFGWFDDSGKPGIVVKDRYWNAWVLDNNGKELWHIRDVDLKWAGIGHVPGIGDIDGDGYDEVFISNTLIDHDGTILWRIPILGHGDTAVILDDIDDRRIITASDKIRCITPQGEVLWSYDAGHEQNAQAGKFSTDPAHGPYQFLGIDLRPDAANYTEGCSMPAKGERLTMYDWNGNILWSREWNRISAGGCRIVRWTGGTDCIAHFTSVPDENGLCPCQILDGAGNVLENILFRKPDGSVDTETDVNADYVPVLMCAADVLGDSRDELILYNGQAINIFTNTAPFNQRRHYNFTHYNGE